MYVDGDWGIRQRGHTRKTWWDCVRVDMRSFSLNPEVAQHKVEWRARINLANLDYLKTGC